MDYWLVQEHFPAFQSFIFNNHTHLRSLITPREYQDFLHSPCRNSALLPSHERPCKAISACPSLHTARVPLLMPAGSSFPQHLFVPWQNTRALPAELEALLSSQKRQKPQPRQVSSSSPHTQLTSWCLLFWQLHLIPGCSLFSWKAEVGPSS